MYQTKLSIKETQKAIEFLKSVFQTELALGLNLTRVSAPLFLDPASGLNDGLNGEAPVTFQVNNNQQTLQVVHSLAKWKRHAIQQYGFSSGEGIYADMNAIRQAETLSPLHSYYVDQWDWEKVITPQERNTAFLETIVQQIYSVLKKIDRLVVHHFPQLKQKLPEQIFFIDAQELEDHYPHLDPGARETELVRQKKAVFIKKIGYPLQSGQPHSNRAADYDDWNLNGDLIVYHYPTDSALELSSMGIRVDATALVAQSQVSAINLINQSPFHKAIIANTLPSTIGGGIGQSRLCMFFLEKGHIGEVQASWWSDDQQKAAKKAGINLL